MNKITGTITFTGERPAWAEPGMEQVGWRIELRYQGRRMGVDFYSSTEPTLADVLECVAMDASGADQTFEDWASGYGYDPDSRSAERTWKACVMQTAKLRRLLGSDFDTITQADRFERFV